jgi:hypothetical protein
MKNKFSDNHDGFITAIIPDGLFHTQDGNCFKWNEKLQCWLKLECYLAASNKARGCDNYYDQFMKITQRLGTSKLFPLRHSLPQRRYTMIDGRLIREDILKRSASNVVHVGGVINEAA